MKNFFFLVVLLLLNSLAIFAIDESDIQRLDKIYQEENELKSINSRLERAKYLKNKKELLASKADANNENYVKHEFFKDTEKLNDALKKQDDSKVAEIWYEIKVCYKNISFLKFDFIYFEALLNNYNGSNEKSISLLDSILNSDATLSLKEKTSKLLLEYQWKAGNNQEVVNIFLNYLSNDSTNEQKYLVAHALYELENFQDAKNYFEELLADPNYKSNANMMLGLITLAENDYLKALDFFKEISLEDRNPFVSLTLARLYSANKEFENAINSYKYYSESLGENPSQEVIYEVANNYFFIDKFDLAKNNLNLILNNPQNRETYNKAKFLFASILQREGLIDEASELLTEEKNNLNEIIEILYTKNRLLADISDIIAEYEDENDKQEKDNFIQNVKEKQSELSNLNTKVAELSKNLTAEDLKIIDKLESKIVVISEDLISFLYLINYLNTTPNEEKAAVIQNVIDESNTDINIIKAFKMCANLDKITKKDFQIALDIVYEIKKTENLIALSNEIVEKIENSTIKNKAEGIKENLDKNIASLNLIGNYYFDDNNSNLEIKKELQNELELIKNRESQLKVLKELVYNNYNKKIASKQKGELDKLISQNSALFSNYEHMISKFKDKNIDAKKEFDYTLMKILFDETLEKDKNFNAKRK